MKPETPLPWVSRRPSRPLARWRSRAFLVDYGTHRGLGEGVEYLIADRYERVLDNVECDGTDIELFGHLLPPPW